MASRILYNNGLQIDQAISGAYENIIELGSGFIRDTGVQSISGLKKFHDPVIFYNSVNIDGNLSVSGTLISNIIPYVPNTYDLGNIVYNLRNVYVGTTGFINNLYVSTSGYIVGSMSIGQDILFNKVASNITPKTDDSLDIGSNSLEFRNLWIDSTGRIDSLHVDENASISGNLFVTGTGQFNRIEAGSINTSSLVSSGNVIFASGLSSTQQITCSSYVEGSSIRTSGSGSFGSLFITGTTVPASTGSAGTAGQIALGGGYLYVCTGTNRWARTHLTGWS